MKANKSKQGDKSRFSTDTEIRGQKAPGWYSDAQCRGLYLKVSKGGGKSFVFRYRNRNPSADPDNPVITRYMGLGPYGKHDTTLDAARKLSATYRQQLREGIDPANERTRLRNAMRAAEGKIPTFSECAKSYINAHAPSWKNPKHRQQWTNTLKTYADPVIGSLPVQLIATDHILTILEPYWQTKTETASRVRGRIEKIIDWATARKYRTGDNPARWKGRLSAMLPAAKKLKKVRHHPSLPWAEMYDFMRELKGRKGVSPRALEFTILTACRTSEVIAAEWCEFHLDAALWTVPSERTKSARPHWVPLSKAALAILKAQRGLDKRWVFPGTKENSHISNMSMLELLQGDMGKPVTVHGFRSSFRVWAAEETNFAREICESALSHANKDETEAAYLHEEKTRSHFKKRIPLMKRWADHCTTMPATAKVIKLAQA